MFVYIFCRYTCARARAHTHIHTCAHAQKGRKVSFTVSFRGYSPLSDSSAALGAYNETATSWWGQMEEMTFLATTKALKIRRRVKVPESPSGLHP